MSHAALHPVLPMAPLIPFALTERNVRQVMAELAEMLSSKDGLMFLSPEVLESVMRRVEASLRSAHQVWPRSYDADLQFNSLFHGNSLLLRLPNTTKTKVKAILVTALAIAYRKFNTEVQLITWDLCTFASSYSSAEAYALIADGHEDEWQSLLSFRNALILTTRIMKEWNKNIMETAAGIMSNFFLCMSGGKPSKQVIRRHAIYHRETDTVVKPRNSSGKLTLTGRKRRRVPRDFRDARSLQSSEALTDESDLSEDDFSDQLAEETYESIKLSKQEEAILPAVELSVSSTFEPYGDDMPASFTDLFQFSQNSWACTKDFLPLSKTFSLGGGLGGDLGSRTCSLNSTASTSDHRYKGSLTEAVHAVLRNGGLHIHGDDVLPILAPSSTSQ